MRAMHKTNQIHRKLVPLQITLVTDTQLPRKNGLSAPVSRMVQSLSERELEIHLIRPRRHAHDKIIDEQRYSETLVSGFLMPGHPGLKSGLPARRKLLRMWKIKRPDIVHIATEGLLGWSALSAAREMHIPVSTDIHSHFHRRSRYRTIGLMQQPIEAYLRHFHNQAACTLVHNESLQEMLAKAGYQNVRLVTDGLDDEIFHPSRRKHIPQPSQF